MQSVSSYPLIEADSRCWMERGLYILCSNDAVYFATSMLSLCNACKLPERFLSGCLLVKNLIAFVGWRCLRFLRTSSEKQLRIIMFIYATGNWATSIFSSTCLFNCNFTSALIINKTCSHIINTYAIHDWRLSQK